MRIIFCLFFSIYALFAYSYEFLTKQPNSLAKDYYLYNLYENSKLKQLKKSDIYRFSPKMKKAYESLHPRQSYKQKYKECFVKKDILKLSTKCQSIRLQSTYFAKNLSFKTRKILAKKFYKSDKNLALFLKELNMKNPLGYIILHNDLRNFLFFFTDKDDYLTLGFIKNAIKSSKIKYFFKKAVIEQNYPLLRKSLLQLRPANVSGEFAFYMGINALSFDKTNLAFSFFKKAGMSAKNSYAKDNSLFWCYLTSKDKNYLKILANSKNLNIYSLYSRELLNLPYPNTITPNPTQASKQNFDMSDPFLWQKTLKKIKSLKKDQLNAYAKAFYFKNSLPIYAFIKARTDEYHYFLQPLKYLKSYSPQRQALIMSIARQESRFIPTAISTSFALGTMQFMPFLARHTAKELGLKDFTPDKLFHPKLAYIFANHHINYLQRQLNHPLFIAYAYNGGIGFTKRMLAKKHMFKPGKYEPFLSMELVPYSESRLYAKKVLANYVVYLSLLKQPKPLSYFLDELSQPL